jgi:RNA polymerase sigma-70 factor (ECF subfamily)
MNPEEHQDLNHPSLPSFNATQFDGAAFEAFFKKHFKELCGFCQYKFDFDIDEARDVVHTGFIKLWENRQNISRDLSVKAYLYKIIINISLDIIKSNKVKYRYIKYWEQTAELVSDHDYQNIDFKQLEQVIENAIASLPEQMRKIFELSRYEELKYTEIAAQLGISVKTVETQMSRALAKLRKKLSYYMILSIMPLIIFFGNPDF